MVDGGWAGVRDRNHRMVVAARAQLCDSLGVEAACPVEMIGSMATISLPDSPSGAKRDAFTRDALQDALFNEWKIEVPVIPWPAPPARLVRISAQIYNDLGQYERLGQALRELCGPA